MSGRSYPRYEAYKPSGVDWLGEIPAHWQVQRLRFALDANPARSEISLSPESVVSFVPMEAVGEYGGLDLEYKRTLDDIGGSYTYFADGDVVVAKITPCFENGKGAIASGLSNGVALGTTELHVLRPHENLQKNYLFYLTISHLFRKLGEAAMYGAGGQKRIPEDFIRDFRTASPPSPNNRPSLASSTTRSARSTASSPKKKPSSPGSPRSAPPSSATPSPKASIPPLP